MHYLHSFPIDGFPCPTVEVTCSSDFVVAAGINQDGVFCQPSKVDDPAYLSAGGVHQVQNVPYLGPAGRVVSFYFPAAPFAIVLATESTIRPQATVTARPNIPE